jgi:hypothetical protein
VGIAMFNQRRYTMFKPVDFLAQTDIVVVGRNPEMADYDNPRGDVHGFASYVRAADAAGNTRMLFVKTALFEAEALEPAEALARVLTKRLINFGKLPVGFERWEPGRPVYGSDAYLEYGADEDLAFERDFEGV